MPIYEYQCRDCKKVHETLQPADKRPKAIVCPLCSGVADYGISAAQWVINGASYANGYIGDSNIKWFGDKKNDG